MSRELSAKEKEFIESQLSSSNVDNASSGDSVDGGDNDVETIMEEARTPWYKRFMTLGFITIGIGLLAVATMLYVLARLRAIFGAGGLDYLAEQGLTPELIEISGNSGFTWISQAMEIYSHRALIIGGILIVTLLIALIFFVLDYIVESRKSGKTEEEVMRMILGDDYDSSSNNKDDSMNEDSVDDNVESGFDNVK